MEFILLSIVITCVGGALYFLPSILAYRNPNIIVIFVLNLLLGWTVLGWIVCLLMALWKKEKPEPTIVYVQQNQPVPPISLPSESDQTEQ